MTARRNRCLAFGVIASLFALTTGAGEKVQFRGSTSIQLPKPTRALEDARAPGMADGPSGRGEYDSRVAPASAPMMTTPKVDKKLKEYLDKKKNWIFVNPYETQYDAKTEEFMKGEKGTGLYEHRLLQGEEKSVMEKYIEEKSPSREAEHQAEARGREPDRSPKAEMARANERAQDQAQERQEISVQNQSATTQKPGENGLSFSLEQKTPVLFDKGPLFEQKQERIFSDRPLMDRPETTLSKEDMRKERDTRDAEITRMLQPRDTSTGIKSRFDPINTAVDGTRQEANPIGGRRTDSFLSPGRSQTAVGGFSGGATKPIFSGGSTPGSIAARGGFDFGSKAAAAPSAFGPNSVSAPIVAPRPSVNSKPFVLPPPQRKF